MEGDFTVYGLDFGEFDFEGDFGGVEDGVDFLELGFDEVFGFAAHDIYGNDFDVELGVIDYF